MQNAARLGPEEQDTERIVKGLKQVIAELNTCEENDFKEIVDHLYDGMCILDGKGVFLFVNKAYSKIMGIKKEDIVGCDVRELEGKLYRGAVSPEVIKRKVQVNSVGVSLLNGNKVLITGLPIFDKDGNVKRVVCNHREMTDLLEMRAKLEDSQKKLKEVKKHELIQNQEIEHLRKQQIFRDDIIGLSAQMGNILNLVRQVAGIEATVLITGETGTGKEVIANEIYFNSNRKNGPFIKLNCAAIPANLLESELFGYQKGAFTGANTAGKIGLFELANKGTLLLDELGDMPMELQVKLLRAIQDKEITRIGGTERIKLDVRIIAATNKNLREEVEKGVFREDLFYRLNVIPINIPPLRERKEDIEHLARHFLNIFNRKYNKAVEISESGYRLLEEYHWPGNIRELQNIIERLVVISSNEQVINENQLANMLSIKTLKAADNCKKALSLKEMVENVERKALEKALKDYGTTRAAAKALHVDQSTIVKKAKRLGLSISR
jgi:PAS domain S-box-containing protein